MTITALPSAPLPTDNAATFNTKAFALVAALNTLVTEANALGVAVDADAISAAADALTATNAAATSVAAANYKGAWSGLSGALGIPASVSHLSKVWILTESVSNVAAETPGTSAKWLAVSVNFASPGPIGSSTPSTGVFTTLADQKGDVRDVPKSGSAKTTSYQLTTSDVGQYIEIGSGGSITIPDAVFSAGDVISLFNNTSAGITVTCTITTAYISGTDSDKATVTIATRGLATILFLSGTVCVIGGNVS